MLLTACGDASNDRSSSSDARSAGSDAGSVAEGSITVSAATSLTGAFTDLAEEFAAANPGVRVSLNFGASSALASQILEGAPADVYASADEIDMARITDEGLIAGEPVIFARNELVIVTRPGDPDRIGSLADLVDIGVVALCGEEVPCGRYAAEALEKAGVTIDESSITRGQNVGATLTAVAEGDAIAGIVYRTDARAAGDRVEVVPMPDRHNVIATYPIGVLRGTGHLDAADAFLAHLRSPEGRAVLARHGFVTTP